MSSAVSSCPSAPGCTKLHAHCCPITRTWGTGSGGSVCFTFTQMRTAKKRISTSNTSTQACGPEIQRLSSFSSPVM